MQNSENKIHYHVNGNEVSKEDFQKQFGNIDLEKVLNIFKVWPIPPGYQHSKNKVWQKQNDQTIHFLKSREYQRFKVKFDYSILT